MTYTEFETALFRAIAQAEGTAPRGQVNVLYNAESVMPGVSQDWVLDAVKTYEGQGWLGNVVRAISPVNILVTLSGTGRKVGER